MTAQPAAHPGSPPARKLGIGIGIASGTVGRKTDTISALALPLGFVDVNVNVWIGTAVRSGLKLDGASLRAVRPPHRIALSSPPAEAGSSRRIEWLRSNGRRVLP